MTAIPPQWLKYPFLPQTLYGMALDRGHVVKSGWGGDRGLRIACPRCRKQLWIEDDEVKDRSLVDDTCPESTNVPQERLDLKSEILDRDIFAESIAERRATLEGEVIEIEKLWKKGNDRYDFSFTLEDPEGWYSAYIKKDGCIDFSRFFNRPLSDPRVDSDDDIDRIHICDLDDLIERLKAIRTVAHLRWGRDWPA